MHSSNNFTRWSLYIALAGVLSLAGCDDSGVTQIIKTYDFTFAESWEGGFTDYPAADESIYELDTAWTTIPASAGGGPGFYMTGSNRSDDLFMFVKKEVTGLAPNTAYLVSAELVLASNAPTEAVGIGGAPGESVFVKFGVTKEEPNRELDADGYYQLTITKGNQGNDSDAVKVLGHVGVAPEQTTYALILRSTSSQIVLQTDNNGKCWILVGTDSGFEGTTSVYYKSIAVIFNKVLPD